MTKKKTTFVSAMMAIVFGSGAIHFGHGALIWLILGILMGTVVALLTLAEREGR